MARDVGRRRSPILLARVVWRNEALDQLDAIISYIRQVDSGAADRTGRRLRQLGDSLSRFPHRGRPAGDHRRELVSVAPHVLTYEATDAEVAILDIRHGAMLSPAS